MPVTPKILDVVAPINPGCKNGELTYSHTNVAAQLYNRKLEPDWWKEFLTSTAGSEEEEFAAKQIAIIQLGNTALQLQQGVKDEAIIEKQAEWFTKQSEEIYGEQDREATVSLLRSDVQSFIRLRDVETVDQGLLESVLYKYASIGIDVDSMNVEAGAAVAEVSGGEAFEKMQSVVKKETSWIMDYFDADKIYESDELIAKAKELIELLKLEDPQSWGTWEVVKTTGGSMSVDARKHQLKIGINRAQSLGIELVASLAHEIDIHARRVVNGEKLQDDDLAYGAPNYSEFEEGLGCYVELLITGKVPSKIINRQIAASLASGQFNEVGMDRNEIFEFLKARSELLMQAEGVTGGSLYEAKIKELRTLIVDRFFRGGKGSVAVFMKDVVYAQGFDKVAQYVHEQIVDRGVDPQELYDYLRMAKIDPTIASHRASLEAKGVFAPSRKVA